MVQRHHNVRTTLRRRWYLPADWPILFKILLGIVAMVVVAMGALTFSNNRIVTDELRETIGVQFQTLAESEARRVLNVLSEQLSILHSLTLIERIQTRLTSKNLSYSQLAPEVIEADLKTLDAEWLQYSNNDPEVVNIVRPSHNLIAVQLLEYQNSFPDHLDFIVTDRYGGLESATHRPDHYYQGDAEWWQRAFNDGEGSFYISQPVYDEGLGEDVVYLAGPIYDTQSGEVLGIIRTAFRIDSLFETLNEVAFGETGFGLLVDRDGNVLTRESVSNFNLQLPEGQTVESLLGQSGWAEIGGDTESPSLVGYASIDVVPITHEEMRDAMQGLGWVQIVTQSREEAYAPVSRANEAASVIAVLILAISVGYAVVVSRVFVRPLVNLVGIARQLSAGDRNVRARSGRRDETGELADAFNTLADEVAMTLGTLEQRVAERTMGLLTAAEVSRAASAAVENPDTMMDEVVNLTRERLTLYYVGLFLLDDDGRFAVLRAGTGEAGSKMLEAAHKLEVGGVSMIGQCIAQNRVRVTGNIETEALHFRNPYLPDTRTELALPLRARGEVIGAMTVQSAEANAFDQEEITVFQIIADQVAIAMNNLQLFVNAQHALREQEIALSEARVAQRRYVREAWQTYPQLASATRYETEPLGEAIQPEISQVIRRRSLLASQGDDNVDHAALVAPITVSEEIIGVLGIHDSDMGRHWTDEEVALFEAVVERVALAIENRRLDEETRIAQQRTEAVLQETSALYRASQALVTATGSGELLDAVSDHAMGSGAASVTLIYLDSDQAGAPEWAEVAAQRTRNQDSPNVVGQRSLVADDPFAGLWLQSPDVPVLVGNVETDTRLSEKGKQYAAQLDTQAFVILPLRSGGRWVGLVICNWDAPQPFTERDDRIYRTLRDQAAVAIDSRRLLRETEARALRERTLRQITERVRGATDPDAIVQIAVRELGTALNRPAFVRLGSTDELVRGPVKAAPDDAAKQDEQGGA